MALLLNLLTIVSTNPLVERLLLVSLELAIAAFAVWGAIRLFRIRSARVCALLWLLVLAKGIFGFVTGDRLPAWHINLDYAPKTQAPLTRSANALRPSEYGLSNNPAATQQGLARGVPSSAAAIRPAALPPESLAHALMQTRRYVILTSSMVGGILATLWMIGVGAILIITMRDLYVIRKLYLTSEAPDAAILRAFESEARRLRVKAAPSLRVSEEITTPALIGWFRPVVLLPSWIAEEMAPAQMRWLLGHELMHWKHLDTLGLLVRRAAQAIFWFHPAVWFAGKCWEQAMERACDRALVSDMDEARDYAQQLYGILSKLTRRKALPSFSTGLFVTRTQVGRRIELLLTNPLAMPSRLGAASIGSLLIVAALTLPAGISAIDRNDDAGRNQSAAIAADQDAPPGEGGWAGATPPPALITLTDSQMNGWLRIDLGDQKAPPGWIAWAPSYVHGVNEHTTQAFSVPFDAYFEIEVSHDVLWRRDPHADQAGPRDMMLRDGIRSFGEIRLTFRDLDPGDYELAPVSFSPEGNSGSNVKFDVVLNGNLCMRAAPMATADTVDSAFIPPIHFTVANRPDEDQTEVSVGFRPQGGALWLSGFMLRKSGAPFGDAVRRMETASGRTYALASAAVGEKAYVDREYTIVSLPIELEHQILVQTANDDKNLATDRQLSLEVGRPVTLYVCYATGGDRLPDWMQGFEPIESELVTTDRIYDVYSKRFPAGTIALGGNQRQTTQNGRQNRSQMASQYIVVIAPDPAPESR